MHPNTRFLACLSLALFLALAGCGGGGTTSTSDGAPGEGSGDASGDSNGGSGGDSGGDSGGEIAGGGTNPPPPAAGGSFALTAWNDLGMHCMDGKDYSVFSILPPYNNLHAQLVDRRTGKRVGSGVTLTYESMADDSGSLNTYSAGKVNFWQYAETLYGAPAGLQDDMGLAGFPMASLEPAPMRWNSAMQSFEAEGIPITPFDDAMQRNFYPMVRVVARDSASQQVLATADVVLPVSDELSCKSCHASGSVAAARPDAGWINDPDPERDWKRNVLRVHDDGEGTKLLAGADGGTPVLCASCHSSNALPGTGKPGVSPLTQAIHDRHASAVDPANGKTLDASDNRSACYNCHPGADTKCLRGAMGDATDAAGKSLMSCQSCHGDMSAVGSTSRDGWLDEPNCQACHFDGRRELSAFDAGGRMREPADTRFATQMDKPAPGYSLYRFSAGHGGMQCEGCHGATHAIYPSSEPNDNVLATALQGHEGTIGECSVCHESVPFTATGGPHGMHSIGARWVGGHEDAAERDSTQCAACHGSDYRGSPLSEIKVERTYNLEHGTRTFAAGHEVGCYECHNGPRG